MDARALKDWMRRAGWKVVDVASETQVSSDTVERFLKGRKVRPIVLAAFARLISTPAETVKRA